MCSANSIKTTNVGSGASPRIYPRPAYPPFWKAMMWDVHHSVEVGLIGMMLVQLLLPIYERTRELAVQADIDDKLFFTLAMFAVHTSTYLAVNSFYCILDTFQIAQSFKLFRKPHMIPKDEQIKRLGLDQAISHLVAAPLSLYIAAPLFLYFLLPLDAPLPSLLTAFLTFPVMSEVNGILFYCGHRLLHTKYLYKTIHKKHHEFHGSVGYAAEYAHPLEGLLGNQLPIFAGMILLRPLHPLFLLVWTMMGLQQTYEGHSGYCFIRPESSGPLKFLSRAVGTVHHDFHHTHNQGNFGGPVWVDWVFGTMDHYQYIGGYEGYLRLKKCRKEN